MRTELSSMRHGVKLMVAAACLSATVGVCAAETFPYGGILQPNVEYTFDMVELSATFIPSGTGEILYNCGSFMRPYADSDHNPESYIEGVSQNYIGGSLTYSLSVTKDVPVYFYADAFDVTWNAQPGMVFKITDNEPIEIFGYSVEEGSVLSLTSGFTDVIIYANQGVRASSAKISVDGTDIEADIAMEYEFKPSLAINYVSAVEELLNAGKIHGGEDLTITVYDIANSIGTLYNNGEALTIKYKAPLMPVSLIDVTMPDPFLAYWKPGDHDAVITARYSGSISKVEYLLKYGDFEREEPDGYVEEGDSDDPACPAKIKIDGNLVTIDMSGKQRRPSDMVPSGMDYGNIIVKIYAYDSVGEPVRGSAPGQVGSYEEELTYLYISPADFKTTFTPASGETLVGHDNLYLHLYDYEKITYTGVRFTIENGAYIVVPKSKITETGGPDFDWTLTIPVPEAARTAAKVTVTFEDAEFLDRDDHSQEFTAVYYGAASSLDYTVYPTPGEVSELSRVAIYFETCAEVGPGEPMLVINGGDPIQLNCQLLHPDDIYDVSMILEMTLPETYTTLGIYDIVLPDGYLLDMNGDAVGEIRIRYSISDTGVEAVTADGAPLNVYTLGGRAVITNGTPADLATITRGIYIINGKTVILR